MCSVLETHHVCLECITLETYFSGEFMLCLVLIQLCQGATYLPLSCPYYGSEVQIWVEVVLDRAHSFGS